MNPTFVFPANAGIRRRSLDRNEPLGSRVCGNDGVRA